MPKFKHKELMNVLRDDLLEKIFADKEMQTIPIGAQSTAINVVERILEDIKEENPYATISELFPTNE